jgi:hypothetical protein
MHARRNKRKKQKDMTCTCSSVIGLMFALASVMAASGAVDPLGVQELYVVWSNHFDAGFTGLTVEVANQFFAKHIPLAIETAATLRAAGGAEQYVWTTEAPWLVDLYLRSCEASAFPGPPLLQCPSDAQRTALAAEIAAGGVAWCAMPFSAQIELLSERTLANSLGLVRALDAALGRSPAAVLNQRDVPGLTAAAIPVLLANGVRAVSVGVNGATAPPAVPPG